MRNHERPVRDRRRRCAGPFCLPCGGAAETGVVRMNSYSWGQLVFYFVVLLALVKPLGAFMARVYQGERTLLDRVFGPVERRVYRLPGVDPRDDMDWKTYAVALMVFNVIGLLLVYSLQRVQGLLLLNPAGLGALSA